MVVQPLRVNSPLVISQMAVASAGTNNHRRTSRQSCVGQVRSESWNIFALLTQRVRRSRRPERKGIIGLRHDGGAEPAEPCKQSETGFHVTAKIMTPEVLSMENAALQKCPEFPIENDFCLVQPPKSLPPNSMSEVQI
jgi:hypothetical protein